jgi:succinyl-CoA synthetase beta subunit
MKLQEYHAKTLLAAAGLPVPPYSVATTAAEARAAATQHLEQGGGKVVIKAQVLVGGRGKAGGVKLASTADEAEEVAGQILGMDIKGTNVRRVLVGPAADIQREYYLSTVLDRTNRRIVMIGSAEGGV